MARGRKPNLIPSVSWNIHVPTDLAAQVELRLFDPSMGKAGYAERSKLIQALLREWIAKQQTTRSES